MAFKHIVVDDQTNESSFLTSEELESELPGTPGEPGAVAWGDIGGTLNLQTDLQGALNAKADTATTLSGYGITDAVGSSDARLTDARPASDVSTWAKAANKPTYTAAEVGADASGLAAAAQAASLPLHGKADTAGVADSASGNAATATKLAATKTINGVAFDGSANISVPWANRTKGIAVVTGTAARTLSAADLVAGKIQQLTGTTARTFTLDTGANISTAFTSVYGAPAAGDVFQFLVANAASAAITVAGASGSTMANAVTVATLQSRVFWVLNTGTNAWTIY